MSNPTNLVASFSSTLAYTDRSGAGVFTGVDPIRYDAGLWLEEAATNLNVNPIGSSGVGTGWIQVGTGSISYADGYLAALRSGTAAVGQNCTGTNRPSITVGQTLSVRADLFSNTAGIGASGRLRIRFFNVSDAQIGEQTADTTLSATAQTVYVAGVAPANTTYAVVAFLFTTTGTSGQEIRATNIMWRVSDYQTSAVPVLSGGTPVAGYAWTSTAHQSTSTRAASSASVTMTEPVSVACWYREAYSGAKTFAYLDTLGQLGDYGDISYAAGDLTISTSRNLVIGPFAAFDRALTATEQANLRSTQNWSMNSVNGSNIILPLSGRRRPR